MSDLNYDILVRNIDMLRKNNGLSQAQFADRIGMSQPNLSKALNPLADKRFNLDQVYKIAQYFEVSVDWLLGYATVETKKFPFEANAKWIVDQVNKGYMTIHEITIREQAYDDDDPFRRQGEDFIEPKDKDVTYQALLFPQYIPVIEDAYGGNQLEALTRGNATGLDKMNEFLKKLRGICADYDDEQRDRFISDVIDSYKDCFNHVGTRL